MKLPFIDSMKEEWGNTRYPRPVFHPVYTLKQEDFSLPESFIDYKYFCELAFTQKVNARLIETNVDIKRTVQRNAVHSICRVLYGPLDTELRAALEELWQDGLYDHPAAKRLTNLLPVLRGENI